MIEMIEYFMKSQNLIVEKKKKKEKKRLVHYKTKTNAITCRIQNLFNFSHGNILQTNNDSTK